jgi:methylmalonyl-CoA carboxyltransferase 12S subunit
MKSEIIDTTEFAQAIELLRREVAQLRQRTTVLEQRLLEQPRETALRPGEQPISENQYDELILAISAAIAAYLGVKPHIRQIRLLASAPWGQQGRVTIQASHALAVHHGGEERI